MLRIAYDILKTLLLKDIPPPGVFIKVSFFSYHYGLCNCTAWEHGTSACDDHRK